MKRYENLIAALMGTLSAAVLISAFTIPNNQDREMAILVSILLALYQIAWILWTKR